MTQRGDVCPEYLACILCAPLALFIKETERRDVASMAIETSAQAGWQTVIQLLPQLKIYLAYQPVESNSVQGSPPGLVFRTVRDRLPSHGSSVIQ